MSMRTPPGGRSAGRASVPGSRAGGSPLDGPGRAYASAKVGAPGPALRPAGPGGRPPYRGRPRPRWGRIAIVAGLALALLAGVGSCGAWAYYRSLNDELNRTDPFAQITGGRPAKPVSGALNILVLGSDSRDPESKDAPGEWRTDTIILMHVPASHDKAYAISLPRDLYVSVPEGKHGPAQQTKLNSAFAIGGLPLAVRTVERYTDVRIDHVVLIDFGGFKQVVDALGGVDLEIEQDVTSIHQPFRKFRKGKNRLTGEEALDYIRQRKQFPDGDFARMRHQQQFMRALMDQATSTGTLSNPVKLNGFLKSVTKAMTVDQGFSLADMAVQFRALRSDDLTFLTSPHLGARDVGGESVVVSDRTKASALYDAVTNDKVADWAKQQTPASTKAGG
jgi:LCP family protein required for cell wall assembly